MSVQTCVVIDGLIVCIIISSNSIIIENDKFNVP